MIALDANKLEIKIMENGFTICDVSNLLGLNRITTYRKLSSISKLTIGEALKLKFFLGLSDLEAVDVFFGED